MPVVKSDSTFISAMPLRFLSVIDSSQRLKAGSLDGCLVLDRLLALRIRLAWY
jgi:hypothetical protein